MRSAEQAKAMEEGGGYGGGGRGGGGGGGGGYGGGVGGDESKQSGSAQPKWPPSGAGSGESKENAGSRGDTPKSSQQQQQQAGGGRPPASASSAGGRGGSGRGPPIVHGVPLSAAVPLLEDAEKAFEHFRSQWPRQASIEENKASLREKYDLAKQLYEKVMTSRSTIGVRSVACGVACVRQEGVLSNFFSFLFFSQHTFLSLAQSIICLCST